MAASHRGLLDLASRVLMLSQAGPGGSRALLTALLMAPEFRPCPSGHSGAGVEVCSMPCVTTAQHSVSDHRCSRNPRGSVGKSHGASVGEAGARLATNVFLRDSKNASCPGAHRCWRGFGDECGACVCWVARCIRIVQERIKVGTWPEFGVCPTWS